MNSLNLKLKIVQIEGGYPIIVKFTFTATIISIQPRIRLTRSFDESPHTYLDYTIKLEGNRQSADYPFNRYS